MLQCVITKHYIILRRIEMMLFGVQVMRLEIQNGSIMIPKQILKEVLLVAAARAHVVALLQLLDDFLFILIQVLWDIYTHVNEHIARAILTCVVVYHRQTFAAHA